MYLSRLILNPRSRRAQRESAEPYQLHRTIMHAFPEVLPADERVLFRLETDRRTGILTLLVQSHGRPDWTWLDEPEQKNYLLEIPEPNPWVKTFDPVFSAGQQLVFRLRANPTVKRDGRRRGLYQEEERLAWLQRKAADNGFMVLSVQLQNQGFVQGPVFRHGTGHNLHMLAVQFDGHLQVVEPARFWAGIQRGIGSGKGLGFGLLSVAPVPL